MTAEHRLLIEDLDDRMVVTLNRPSARNAIDLELGSALHDVCARLEHDPKPMILTGGAGLFAAGADIKQLLGRGRHEALAGINSSLFERVHRLPMPTVAAVDGYAIGGGAELAYACDIRIGTPRTRFANPEPDLGIMAGAGATWRLKALVGEPLAKQVLLAGHQIDAEEALACRLIAEIVPPEQILQRAYAMVDRMTAMSPIALRLTKLVFDSPAVHPTTDLIANAILFEDSEKYQRMTAFVARQTSRTTG